MKLIQQSNTVPCSLLHSCFKIILLSITCNLRPVFHHDLQPVFCSYFVQLYFILSALYWARSKQNEIYIHGKKKGRITVQKGRAQTGQLDPCGVPTQGKCLKACRVSFLALISFLFSVCLFPFRIFVFTKLLIVAEFT